ncbi:MAG TPA: response regulator transcription factor [Acidobacteriota bacterium]|nr:response regulator transcription factor [Acidobacteriota bacterium]
MIRVFIADDHPLVREGLKKLLHREPDIEVAGETGDVDEVEKKLKEDPYDVLILDISFPKKSGMVVLRELHKSLPELPVIMFSALPKYLFGEESIKAGAQAYIHKESASENLVNAIRRVVHHS